jgi:hypothetical protein
MANVLVDATISGLSVPGALKVAVRNSKTSEEKWANARTNENIVRR